MKNIIISFLAMSLVIFLNLLPMFIIFKMWAIVLFILLMTTSNIYLLIKVGKEKYFNEQHI